MLVGRGSGSTSEHDDKQLEIQDLSIIDKYLNILKILRCNLHAPSIPFVVHVFDE